jgi:hypothetical protein
MVLLCSVVLTWFENNTYINMDLLREQKKQALKIAAQIASLRRDHLLHNLTDTTAQCALINQ